MAKMVKCKSCGKEIAKTAKTCPNCGAKQHNVAITICVVILVLAVIGAIGSIAGGNSGKPQKVGDASSPSQASQSGESKPEKTTFTVGEKVDLDGVVVTLVNVTESNGAKFYTPEEGKVFIHCEFEIENTSDKDISVSSIMSFEAYINEYSTNASITATLSSDKPQLDGTVAAGKKMNGVIGYEASKDWSTIEVRFTPSFWSRKDIIFTYKK